MRPVIGITTRMRDVTSSAGVSATHTINRAYPDAVARAGGLAMLLIPVPGPDVGEVARRLDGLVLSGGGDVDPARYGGRHHDSVYDVDPERDEFEIALVAEAAARRLPTLAICRGLQVLNVALGGSLIVDIPSEVAGSLTHSRVGEHVHERHQRVTLDPGCRLASVLGAQVDVNSIHHQAVDRVAAPLRVVGTTPDGVVEAVEHEDDSWPLWAVQWHPEYLAERHGDALSLFEVLVGAARAARDRGSV